MPRKRKGGSSQDRRRARRAAARRDATTLSLAQLAERDDDIAAVLAMTAAASGSTGLPLSDRGAGWDAGAAEKSLDVGQYGDAHFWRDPEGDAKTLAAYKLPFASSDGGLTAIWKGITACAGALQGARGGVKIPSGDVAGVKTRVAAYYSKAAKKYDDPAIKPPWEASEGQSAALLLAYAEIDPAGLDLLYAESEDGDILVGVGGSGPEMDAFLERRAFWEAELAPEPAPEAEDFAVLAARARGTLAVGDVWERRRATKDALVASGAAAPQLVTNYEMTQGSLTERWFVQAALTAGYTDLAGDSWPSEARSLENADDPRVIFRDGDTSAVYRLDDGTLACVSLGWGSLRMHVAAPSRDAGINACTAFRAHYPASYLIEEDGANRVPITFWTMGEFGPIPRLRKVDSASWDDIAGNYSGQIRDQIGSLMEWSDGPPADGQLILWQGEPGTGKTWALRALASEWAKWAEFHYITDPDAFFVSKPSYMIDVLLADSYGAIDVVDGDVYEEQDPLGKWRVLLLEDTGELLAANAKEAYGQGLSRLLNVVDGMIGQGLRVLAIVTTNDELGDLHPAVARPGRCAAQIEFDALSPEEASAWLTARAGEAAEVAEPMTLAELYAHADPEPAFAPMPEDECANCEHTFADVTSDGSCSIEGCDCQEFEAMDGDLAVAPRDPDYTPEPEDGRDLMAAAGEARLAHFELRFDDETIARAAAVLAEGASLITVDDGVASPDLAIDGRIEASLRAAFAGDVALPEDHAPGETLPAPNASPSAPEDIPADAFEWNALFVPEATLTDDGRAFAPGSLSWRELPLTLMGLNETSAEGGHDGAVACGRIDRIWRDGSSIRATGVFSKDDIGAYFAANVGDGTIRGLSIDIAIHDYETGPRDAYFDADGNWRDGAPVFDENAEPVDPLDILFGGEIEDQIFVVTDGVIGMATVCPFPAFAEANIALAASGAIWTYTAHGQITVTRNAALTAAAAPPLFQPGTGASDVTPLVPALTAAAAGLAPLHPPADWFENPDLEELTALTISDEGRIYGHAWAWDTCHTAFADVCTTAPHSAADYDYFHLKEVECDGGDLIQVGTITLDTGHAPLTLGRAATVSHYDNTGTAVADIVVGEDEHGGWFSGALRPDIDAELVRKLRGAVLSGDWRGVDGNQELVALLAVNVPGFPVPRRRALVASGEEGNELLALVAAGISTPGETITYAQEDDYAAIAKLAATARAS